MSDTMIDYYIDESGNRGVPLTETDQSDIYALTGGLVDAACERFPELLAWNVGSDGIGQTLAETIERMIVNLRREPRSSGVAEAFGFEVDNVIARRPCGRCSEFTEKEEVRGTLGDFGVICERCMDELGLLDEYNYVSAAYDHLSVIQPWIDGHVNSDADYAAMMNEAFTELRRRYREQPPF